MPCPYTARLLLLLPVQFRTSFLLPVHLSAACSNRTAARLQAAAVPVRRCHHPYLLRTVSVDCTCQRWSSVVYSVDCCNRRRLALHCATGVALLPYSQRRHQVLYLPRTTVSAAFSIWSPCSAQSSVQTCADCRAAFSAAYLLLYQSTVLSVHSTEASVLYLLRLYLLCPIRLPDLQSTCSHCSV